MSQTNQGGNKRLCTEDDSKILFKIRALENESNFSKRASLMNEIAPYLSNASKSTLYNLDKIIQEDSLGLFNRTWNSLSFALFVKKLIEVPNGTVAGLSIIKILSLKKKIGEGLFGGTFSAESTEGLCAVKYLSFYIYPDDSNHSESEEVSLEHLEEVILLSKVRKSRNTIPFCVKILGIVISSDNRVGLAMHQYNSDLHQFILNTNLSNDEKLRLFQRCVKCLQVVHDFGIVHNNVKTQNFLIEKSNSNISIDEKIDSIVITDFGFAKERVRTITKYLSGRFSSMGDVVGTSKCTVAYAAPEILEARKKAVDLLYTKQSDIFSLGVVLGSIITQKEPYANLKSEFQILSQYHQIPRFNTVELNTAPLLLAKLFYWCTSSDINIRPKSCKSILILLDEMTLQSTELELNSKINSIKNNDLSNDLKDYQKTILA